MVEYSINKKTDFRFILVLIVFIASVVIVLFNLPHREQKITIPPVDITLEYTQGAPQGSSLLIMRLFSQVTRQAMLDNVVRKDNDKKEIVPVKLSVGKDVWEKGVSFVVADDKTDKDQEIIKGIKLIRAPEEARIVLGPDDVYQAMYEVSPSSVPAPGRRIRAIFKINKYRIESNTVQVPQPPSTEYEKFLRQARVEFRLKDYDKLLQTADRLVSLDPSEAAGYRYKGITLERSGNYSEAIQSYKMALEKTPPSSGKRCVYPMPIYRRIKQLQKLAGNEAMD